MQPAPSVLSAIEELGYIRNGSASRLRSTHSKIVGLVVLDAGNPFFTDVARGAEAALERRGYSVVLCNSDGSPQRQQRHLRFPRRTASRRNPHHAGRPQSGSPRNRASALPRFSGRLGRRGRRRCNLHAPLPSTTYAGVSSPANICSRSESGESSSSVGQAPCDRARTDARGCVGPWSGIPQQERRSMSCASEHSMAAPPTPQWSTSWRIARTQCSAPTTPWRSGYSAVCSSAGLPFPTTSRSSVTTTSNSLASLPYR